MDWLRSTSARLLLAWGLILAGWAVAEAAPKICDRCAETTTSTGTGTVNLAGPVSKYQGFIAGLGGTSETYYCIVHRTAVEWECGIGTATDASPDTLSRDTVKSSSTGSPVSFTAGTKDVFVSPIADYYNTTVAYIPTNRIRTGDGTAAAPAYGFTSDTDAGVYLEPGIGVGITFDGTAAAWIANGAIFGLKSSAGHGGNLSLEAPTSTNTVARITLGSGASGADPGTPAANQGTIYYDRGNKVAALKDPDGSTSITVRPSTCAAGQFVNQLASGGTLGCDTPAGGGGGVAVDIQTFSSSGTWTKPSGGQTACYAFLCGAGGGGGGGAGAAAGTARTGGGGGGGGYCRSAIYRASDLSGTETVTIFGGGAGGTGGTAGAGADGAGGASSSFGSRLTAPGGGGGSGHNSGAAGGAGGGCTGAGGTPTAATGVAGGACFAAGPATGTVSSDGHVGASGPGAATGGAAGNGSSHGGGAGAASSTSGAAAIGAGGASWVSGGGGGAGGGVNTATPGTAQDGTDGGKSGQGISGTSGGGGAKGVTASACGAGGEGQTGVAATAGNGGAGGGGGASKNSATGCDGGNGGVGGGGGGAGGGGTNTGGTGGDGGAGWLAVICW